VASAHANARRATSPDFWRTNAAAEPIRAGFPNTQSIAHRLRFENVPAKRPGTSRKPARSWTHVHGSPDGDLPSTALAGLGEPCGVSPRQRTSRNIAGLLAENRRGGTDRGQSLRFHTTALFGKF
jgi:hypothetical protein